MFAAAFVLRAAEEAPDLFDLDAVGAGVRASAPAVQLDDPTATKEVRVPVPPGTGEIKAAFRLGKVKSGNLVLIWDSGRKTNIQFRAVSATMKRKLAKDAGEAGATANWETDKRTGQLVREVDASVADACLEILPWRIRYAVRPNGEFYTDTARDELFRKMSRLSSASDHEFGLAVRLEGGEARLYLDGNYLGFLGPAAGLKETAWVLPAAMEKKVECLPAAKDGERWLALDMQHPGQPGAALTNATATIGPGDAPVEGVPLRVLPASAGLAVAGLGRLQCPVVDLCNVYWRHGALDGLPEMRLFSVPQDTYACAHVLCAAEDDTNKVAAFTLRLTRYANSRGDGMADTVAQLSGPDAKQVGTVAYGPEGARRTVPLWLVRVPLKTGMIQDLLREDETKYGFRPRLPARHLELEIMDPVPGVAENDAFPTLMGPTGRGYAPSGPKSSVHIFGITLEKSPAELTVRSSTSIHVFYASDNPGLKAEVVAREAGDYAVAWEFADIEGRIAASGKKELKLAAGERSDTTVIPVAVSNGWHAARVRLLDAAGRELVDHRSAFVMLPPDTRKAGFESPHGAWWFHWAHGGAPDIERVGPLYQRAGLRHATLPEALSEEVTSPYQLSAWCVTWGGGRMTNDTVAGRVDEYERFIRSTLKTWPSIDLMMVDHESDSYTAPFPPELWGATPPPMTGAGDESWRKRMEFVIPLCQMVREKFPGMKIQFGNAGDSCAIAGEYFRRGLPKEYCDYVAVEDLGQTFIPEKVVPGSMQSAWLLRQTARVMGYTNAQITAAYEWMGRRDRALGLGPQAEWYVRDALQARAYGFHSVAIGTIHDAGMTYFHTGWGAGGLCWRYPYMYPKPSYAAMAALTRVLDRAVCERTVPTGSHSLYAVEFRREGEWIYAFWMPRGCREAVLRFADEADLTVADLYGRETRARGRELTLEASTAARYVTTKTRLAGVSAGKARFPEDPPPEKAFVVDPLDAVANVTVPEEKDDRLERTSGAFLPHRTKGRFEVRAVQDAEKGACLELELKPEGKVWAGMHEYAVLRLKEPKAVPANSESVGVWIRGNSGWGDVIWELEDAEGEIWISEGVYLDWQGKIAINFDGWNFLRMKLPPVWGSWRRTGKGNGKLDHPFKVTGLVVTMPRQVLCVTEMTPVTNLTVRVKDLSAF